MQLHKKSLVRGRGGVTIAFIIINFHKKKKDNIEYFSDIEKGLPISNINDIDHDVWAGIASYIDMLAEKGYFGRDFPEQCLDNQGCIGTDNDVFKKHYKRKFQILIGHWLRKNQMTNHLPVF